MIDLLGEADLRWIESVVDVVVRCAGQPWRAALEQLDDLQRASQPTTPRRFSAVVGAVQRVLGGRVRNARIARRARGLVLGHPAFSAEDRQSRIDHAALTLGTTAQAIETILWSDLPRERPIELPGGARPSELEIAAFANVALLQRALRRAQSVQLTMRDDDPGPVVRAAAQRGLLISASVGSRCETIAGHAGPPASRDETIAAHGETTIEIAGPLSLFHGTGVYGRALGELVPLLSELSQWSLAIRVELPLTSYVTHVISPALLPAPPARLAAMPYAIARLLRGLRRLEPRLEVTPAPPALRAGSTLLWPDLVLDDGIQRCFVELVGFWTREYLDRKLAAYRELGLDVILCVDTTRAAGDGAAPAEVLTYPKTLHADAVLEAVRRPHGATTAPSVPLETMSHVSSASGQRQPRE